MIILITACFSSLITVPFDYIFDEIISSPDADADADTDEFETESASKLNANCIPESGEEEEGDEESPLSPSGSTGTRRSSLKSPLFSQTKAPSISGFLSPSFRSVSRSASYFGEVTKPSPNLSRENSMFKSKKVLAVSTDLKRIQSQVRLLKLASSSSFSDVGDDESTVSLKQASLENREKKLLTTKEVTMKSLKHDFQIQRMLKTGSELSHFEKEWRWDNEKKSFLNDSMWSYYLPCIFPSLEKQMERDMIASRNQAELRVSVLKTRDEHAIGIEILHLFVVDLLGRDTLAAKTFMIKTRAE
jgi:hypothetical protein